MIIKDDSKNKCLKISFTDILLFSIIVVLLFIYREINYISKNVNTITNNTYGSYVLQLKNDNTDLTKTDVIKAESKADLLWKYLR